MLHAQIFVQRRIVEFGHVAGGEVCRPGWCASCGPRGSRRPVPAPPAGPAPRWGGCPGRRPRRRLRPAWPPPPPPVRTRELPPVLLDRLDLFAGADLDALFSVVIVEETPPGPPGRGARRWIPSREEHRHFPPFAASAAAISEPIKPPPITAKRSSVVGQHPQPPVVVEGAEVDDVVPSEREAPRFPAGGKKKPVKR